MLSLGSPKQTYSPPPPPQKMLKAASCIEDARANIGAVIIRVGFWGFRIIVIVEPV